MKLLRFATVYLKRKVELKDRLCLGDERAYVEVQDVSFGGDVPRLLLQAVTALDAWPEVTSQREVIVPEIPRKEAEDSIEAVANVLAVLNHSHRRIASPQPFVALCLENADEECWARNLSRVQGEHTGIPETSYCLASSPENLQALSDRLDGVALLAEALAHEHPTGKFHEFIRLFERAFALAPSQFEKKLAQFLQGADLGYERQEIRQWIELRNPATHANDLAQPRIVLESHVRPFIARMEQAAFDVLLNKAIWANSSRERRPQWRPAVATIAARNDVRITKGLDANFQVQMLDPFEAFMYDNQFKIPPTHMAKNFWASWPNTRIAFKGMMKVEEQPSVR